jgi:hypothetical protein
MSPTFIGKFNRDFPFYRARLITQMLDIFNIYLSFSYQKSFRVYDDPLKMRMYLSIFSRQANFLPIHFQIGHAFKLVTRSKAKRIFLILRLTKFLGYSGEPSWLNQINLPA